MKILTLILVAFAIGTSASHAADTYTVVRGTAELTEVKRIIEPESGDWVLVLNYTYGKEGHLNKIVSEYSTFSGYDSTTEEFHSTKCVREYEVEKSKKLTLKSELITDLKTGKIVQRKFQEPKVTHWMTVATLPKKPKAEPKR